MIGQAHALERRGEIESGKRQSNTGIENLCRARPHGSSQFFAFGRLWKMSRDLLRLRVSLTLGRA